MSAPRNVLGSSSYQPQEMEVGTGQQGDRIRKRDRLMNAFTRGASVIGELGSRLDRSREGERRIGLSTLSSQSSSSSSSPVAESHSPESNSIKHGVNLKSMSCSVEDKNEAISKIDTLIALRQEIITPPSPEKQQRRDEAREQFNANEARIKELQEESAEFRKAGSRYARRAIQLPAQFGPEMSEGSKVASHETIVVEMRSKVEERQERISQLKEANQQLIPIFAPEESYAAIVHELGDFFAEDLQKATELHALPNVSFRDMFRKNTVDQQDHTLAALQSIKEALTGGIQGDWAALSPCRDQFGADAWRSAVVIRDSQGKKYLLSQSDLITTLFQKIEAPGYPEGKGKEQDTPVPHYHLEDALEHAKQADANFQMPSEGEISGNGRGKWTAQRLEKFLDLEGVSLVERHRIYSKLQQGTMADYVNPAKTKRGIQHYEKARTLSDPKERFAEYCRAGLEVGGLGLSSPDPGVWGEDKEFMAVCNGFWDILVERWEKEKFYTLSYELDLHTKTVHGHFLACYVDPLTDQKKRYYHHIEYDYARDRLVGVTTTEGVKGFPRPEESVALDKFPFEILSP